MRLEPSLPTVQPLSWLLFSLSSKNLLLCQFIQNALRKKKKKRFLWPKKKKAEDRWAFPETCSFGVHSLFHTIMPWVLFCCCRFGEGYIITVRVQGDLPDLDPLFRFFSEKLPRATLKVGAGSKSVLAFV